MKNYLYLTAIFTILLFISFPKTSQAIAIDGSCSTFSGTSVNTITKAHTMSTSDNNLLVVQLTHADQTTNRVTSITYNGTSLKKVQNLGGAFDMEYMYYLAGVPAGSANLVINFSVSQSFGGNICNYSGVDQTSPFLVGKSVASYPTASITTDLKASSTGYAIGTAHNNWGAFTGGTNTTIKSGTSRIIWDSNADVSGTTTYQLTKPSSSDGVMIVGIFKPVSTPVDISWCVYANIPIMTNVIGQSCVTDGATTTCTYDNSPTTTPVIIRSDDLIFALSVIIFFIVIIWLGFMFSPFKKAI